MALLAVLLAFGLGIADLDELARRHDVQWSSDAATGRQTLRWGSTQLVFFPGFHSALVNGMPIPLAAPVALEGGRIKLPPELVWYVEQAPLRRPAGVVKPAPPPATPAPRVEPAPVRILSGVKIAIDAGHGGVHTGGQGNHGLMEKDINLGVAINLQRVLEDWGAQVIMTRTSDTQFDVRVDNDLDARVQIVNAARPDLFLSIHTNYVGNSGPRGFEVWVPRCEGVRNLESRDLADLLRGQLGGVWGANEDRGTKDEHNLRVLKGTHCPAALVELEFVSNPGVERQLATASRQRELAAAIGGAIRSWVGRHLR